MHLFCGIVGPVLVTFHTSFKFNGIVSAAYWSMVIVVLSGFVGRYLYVRIPRSIRGNELTRAELDARAGRRCRARLAAVGGHRRRCCDRIDAFERAVVPPERGRLSLRTCSSARSASARRLRALDRELDRRACPTICGPRLVRLAAERATLLRRIAYLQRTKTLFELWHVFHLPLVYLLLVIVAAHVGVTLYLGYVPFRW